MCVYVCVRERERQCPYIKEDAGMIDVNIAPGGAVMLFLKFSIEIRWKFKNFRKKFRFVILMNLHYFTIFGKYLSELLTKYFIHVVRELKRAIEVGDYLLLFA